MATAAASSSSISARVRCSSSSESSAASIRKPRSRVDRIESAVRLELLGIDVARRVVGGVVGAHAVGARLDQRRSAAGAGAGDRTRGRLVDGEEVVAVDQVARKSVAGGASREAAGGLLGHRGGDRPAVVLEEEDDRRTPHAGQVAGLVEVAFGRAAVAEVHAHGAVEALVAQAPRQPDGVGELSRERDLNRQQVHPGRHVVALGVAHAVEEEALERVALMEHRGQFAVLGDDPVPCRVEGERGADYGCLLAVDRREDAEPPWR